jgi:hypothetical protein
VLNVHVSGEASHGLVLLKTIGHWQKPLEARAGVTGGE